MSGGEIIGRGPLMAMSVDGFNRWLLIAKSGDTVPWLDGLHKPRLFQVSKAVFDADVSGLVNSFFNPRNVPPAYMAQRTSKPLPPHLSARVGGPRPSAPSDAEAVLAAVECSVGARGLLPPLAQIAAAAHTPLQRVRAAIDWLVAHGLMIIQNLIIGTQRRRYVILS